ncbi:lipopolysaccharide biosynthesis protein [Halobacterium sp. MBLA0001]|uniref:lipopolysaccharide biosynthesis protein n=1 Tax=Halobacterium sp. MBLA0001 TaxID=3413511 RepID=UPI003C71B467
MPDISSIASEGELAKISNTIQSVLPLSIIIVIPAMAGAVLFGPEIVYYAFTEEYVVASVGLSVLMIQRFFQSMYMIFERTLQGLDQPNLAARAKVVAFVVNVLLNLALVPTDGLVGAAATTTVSYGLNMILHVSDLRQLYSSPRRYQKVDGAYFQPA